MLSKDQAAAVAAYCATRHRDINAYLRGEEEGDPWVRAAVQAIDAAIAGGRLATDTVLYRGVDDTVARHLLAAGLKPGSIVRDDAYTSTSADVSAARLFASWPKRGVIWRIHAASGTTALEAHRYSAFPGEREVLLPRGVGMEILTMADADGVMDVKVSPDER